MRLPLLATACLSLFALFTMAAACGARTGLSSDAADASVDAGRDAAPAKDSGALVTSVACIEDSDCDDAIACTRDTCDGVASVCVHLPLDERCDDGIFCNGDEKCEPSSGCIRAARSCNDGVACTRDACDELAKRCEHAPDDGLCPVSYVCDEASDCQAHAFANGDSSLYDIRLPSGDLRLIGAIPFAITDLALHPDRTLYGVSRTQLFRVAPTTGASTLIASVNAPLVSLDVAPDGSLYAGGGDSIYLLDRVSGALTKFATFPVGTMSSGDLALLEGRLLATATAATGVGNDTLVEFDLVTRVPKTLGSVGFRCVWGLAAFGPTLYGMTCEGRVLAINATTGAGAQITKTAVQFHGATAR